MLPNAFLYFLEKSMSKTKMLLLKVYRMKCASNGCQYSVHTNPANNGGSYCCQGCKASANKHGSACEKTSLIRPAAAKTFLESGPTFNLANCRITQSVIESGALGSMSITIAWNKDPYATSYKVLVGKGSSPIIMNSIINDNFIDDNYFISISNKNICQFVEEYTVTATNAAFMTRQITINKSDFLYNNEWLAKIRLNITVVAYNKTTRGPTPKTVGVLNCFSYYSNNIDYPYSAFLAIKHNIIVTQAKATNKIIRNRYLFNNLFTNVKTPRTIPKTIAQYAEDNTLSTNQEDYIKTYSNNFSNLNVISVKDLVPGDMQSATDIGLNANQAIIRTPASAPIAQ